MTLISTLRREAGLVYRMSSRTPRAVYIKKSCLEQKTRKKGKRILSRVCGVCDVVAQTFNPSTQEADVGRSL